MIDTKTDLQRIADVACKGWEGDGLVSSLVQALGVA